MGRLFISELKDSPIKIYSIFYYDEDGVKRAYQENSQMLTFSSYKQAYSKLESILLERSVEDNALPYSDEEVGSYESNGNTFKFEVVPTDVLLQKTSREKLYDGEQFKILVERVRRVLVGDIGFSDITISGLYKSDNFRRVIVEIRYKDQSVSIREHVPLIQDKTGATCVVVGRQSADTEELCVDFQIENNGNVYLQDIVRLKEFNKKEGIVVAIGKDNDGNYLYNDLLKTGNLLIVGNDKRVIRECVDSYIMSILFKNTPYETQMLLISPNKNEFNEYSDIPHLMLPTVSTTGTGAELKVLRLVIREMQNRQALFAKHGLKDLYGYNKHVEYTGKGIKLPRVLVVIDDIDSLLDKDSAGVENLIRQLPFPQWYTGITIVATSSSPDMLITRKGVLDNFPSRIVFSLDSAYESKKLIGCEGAESLSEYRDMLYVPLASPFPISAKSVTIFHRDIVRTVEYLKAKNGDMYNPKLGLWVQE